MKYIVDVRPLTWKIGSGCWYSNIKVGEIIDTLIAVSTYTNDLRGTLYYVKFTGCSWCALGDDGEGTYTKYGFETVEDAKFWAEKTYIKAMHLLVTDLQFDLRKYVRMKEANIDE